MYPVITISREFGSGGHTIGEQVAKTLDIPFYDGEIVNRVALESGYAKELIEEQGETTSSANKWFDISAASAMYFQSPQDEIFLAQRKVILEAAESGPCVIVGRCSDYILRNAEIPCLNVLIHSDLEHRIKRILERYGDITNVDVKKRIHKKDKQRRTYYRYYTDQHWGVYSNYDLALDSGSLGEETCIHLICELAKNMNR
ncbi:MAG: cytidylate kinase-like family protein [Lachnospiraceae bacterium]|nr:cytidylate kinase-like family protein [Lachnospiraceae bacterium]MBQ5485408.1 cytidylate kinase-like family protein [Lachnospiraceae bacterium]MCR4732976.1 cytidylate kinase-like family protein [Lachnospiraceae bacterium]MEE3355929.1 cytidylate kinase-like family protein [Candidatus Weimeria sp.]